MERQIHWVMALFVTALVGCGTGNGNDVGDAHADAAADSPDAHAATECAGATPECIQTWGGPHVCGDILGGPATCKNGVWDCPVAAGQVPESPIPECWCYAQSRPAADCHCEQSGWSCPAIDAGTDAGTDASSCTGSAPGCVQSYGAHVCGDVGDGSATCQDGAWVCVVSASGATQIPQDQCWCNAQEPHASECVCTEGSGWVCPSSDAGAQD